jgi:mono/diheme cytochrome c family protein
MAPGKGLIRGAAVLPLLCLLLPAGASADMARAAANFERHCAVCHGPSGRPDAQGPVVQGLGVVPANLADPLFSSREPASDWAIVIRHGGPALGFSERMPAFGAVLSAAEIDDLVRYIKTQLAESSGYPPGDLNLFLALRTRKAFPEDEVVYKLRAGNAGGRTEWQNTLEFEKRFGKRFQAALELSHRSIDGDGRLNNIEPGAKYVLHYNLDQGYIATVGGNVEIPLDDRGRPVTLLPWLAFGKILNDAFTFQGSVRAHVPVEDTADEGKMELAGIVHWTHTSWPRAVFPAIEIVADIPFDRGTGLARTDPVQFSILPQARIGLSRRGHVAIEAGAEIPLNDTDRFDYRGYVFLIWDFADGAFWAGW